jgi:hypothetical protein
MSTGINLGGGGGGVGIQGIQGIQGVQGLNGAFAGQGIQGIQGTQGLQGTIGTIGTQGATGIQGTIGNTGSQGIQGITGTQGLQGVQGTNGLQGATGNQGIQGATGVTGNTGAQGVQGITGIQGADGIQGSVGLQGTQGIIGAQGITGTQGVQGIQGTLGENGISGGLNFFFNQSVASTSPFRELGKQTTVAAEQTVVVNLTSNQQDVLVSTGFITVSGVPNALVVPNGIWHSYLYFTKPAINDNITYYFTVSKYTTGAVTTLLFTSDPVLLGWDTDNTTPVEVKTNGVATSAVLDPTDRLIVNIYLNNNQTGTKTVTFYTEGTQHYSYIVTTITSPGVQGTQGVQGIQGTTGTQGATGIQGNFGIQGIQGFQGTIGIQGNTGTQGIQGLTGGTGNTGAQGIQGTTGSQGIQGLLGIQGIVGGTGPTGLPGSQGVQGIQGIQGLPGDPGVVGYYYGAYDTSTQTAGATNTEVIILFSNSYGSNSVSYTAGSFRINEAAVYKIQCEVNWRNADTTNTAIGALYAKINGTAVVGTTTLQTVGPITSESTMIEITQAFNAGDTIQFAFTVDDTDLALRFAAASSPLPSGASAIANIAQVARTLGPLDGNIQLAWTTGFVNLTNGVDNTIPFNSNVFSYGAALSASNLSTANAGIQFLYTGVYLVNFRAHFFDLGSNMILSATLYTSTNGTTWAFSTITGRMRYEGTNTNQIQDSNFLVRVTSLPFYIQPRLQPSANAPFPADLSAPTAFSITRVGDL